jgi:hypothetical protein
MKAIKNKNPNHRKRGSIFKITTGNGSQQSCGLFNPVVTSKKGFELGFSTMFAIIAGAVIIFLAIYASVRFINTSQKALYSESAQSLSNILNPIVNDISVATKSPEVNFRRETRVYLGCSEPSTRQIFGSQSISFSEESGFIAKWSSPGANITRNNKYIFGNNLQQGKTLFIFSKPFYLGYKVDDLVFISMNDYCFVSAPSFIQEELETLGIKNINFSLQTSGCKKDSIKVCFGVDSGCNMSVSSDSGNYDTGKVTRNRKSLDYAGSLLYAAIFSSEQIYECNIKRLGFKTSELAQVYNDKINLINNKNCNSQIGNNLVRMISLSNNLTSTKIKQIYAEAKLMDSENCGASCRVYLPQNC